MTSFHEWNYVITWTQDQPFNNWQDLCWKPTAMIPTEKTDARAGEYPETRVSVQKIEEEDQRLRCSGIWVGAHVDNDAFWPEEPHVVEFERVQLFVLPAKDGVHPAVFARETNGDGNDLRAKISRFLSSWAWADNRGIRISQWTAGSRPFRAGTADMQMITHFFDFEYLPENLSEQAALALAFYREGLSIKHVPYSFLSFYKVINAVHKGKNAQRNWIRDNIEKVEKEDAVARIYELKNEQKGRSIQDYIWNACRNAVAHSHPDSDVVNPDNPDDEARLRKDLPVIKELAELLINSQLGIQTKQDIWDSTKHRLAGARWMIGEKTLSKIEKDEFVSRRQVCLPKKIKLCTRQKSQQPLLCELDLRVTAVRDAVVYFKISSGDGCFQMVGGLDFKVGEVGVDLLNGIVTSDDGSAVAAARIAQVNEFLGELFCNGRLQILEMETGLLIAESKPIIPVNCYFDPAAAKATTNKWLQEAESRRQLSKSSHQ